MDRNRTTHGTMKETTTQAADLLMQYDWKVWFWGDSIGLEGLLDATEYLGKKEYETFVYGLVKGWQARRTPSQRWDYTAPGVALLRLYESTGDPLLLETATEHADYLAGFRQTVGGAYVRYADPQFNLSPQLPSGEAFEIRGQQASDGGPCVFVDNMHFDGPFFSRLYQVTGDLRYRDLAIGNIRPSIQLLFDRQSHLFHHFWSERQRTPNGVFWGRGQGWALLGIVHTLECLPGSDQNVPSLLEVLRQLSGALAAAQDESGHWHTVINDAESYLESSVAAFVVDGFSRAILRGWLPESYRSTIVRAMDAAMGQVAKNGKLDGVSYETYPSAAAEHYRRMPRGAMVPWGQGPLLTAIRSYARLLDRQPEHGETRREA